ncbi:MAG: pantoate--beta-alanine ligase [Candidatus Coatesbacteria bacterium]|nr:MAG: pantoate--beta-alanine ligase [Candidatus Coatesbacteria bacterium]
MDIIRIPGEMRETAENLRRAGLRLGLVPTMGYFHEGHLSLIRRARAECDRVVVSVFVNPTQFGPGEDLGLYPRDFDRDCELAAAEGVDLLFAPAADDVYPPGYATYVDVERLTEGLCGASRPGHFRGVATVVAKLFNLCRPAVAYFGQKDYQQAQVIKRMAADLDFGLQVEVLPIVREPDGLAMSSRNQYLSVDERRQATCLYRALGRAAELFASGETGAERLAAEMRAVVEAEPAARLDYAAVVDANELTPRRRAAPGAVAVVAAFINDTRLIDNTILGTDDLKAGATAC